MVCCLGASASHRLLEAARNGPPEDAAQVITENPRKAYSAQQWGGQNAWHLAAKEGRADVLQAMAAALLSLPPDKASQLSKYGRTPQQALARIVQLEDSKYLTPLHLACIKGHTDAAAALMEFGANPFAMDSVGRTPLHYASSWGHAGAINAVLGAHSDTPKPEWTVAWPNDENTRLVDVKNSSGFTPLHYAVWVGRKEAIQALASYEPDLRAVNIANDFDWIKVGTGNTPLHLAAFGGDVAVVRLLLAAHVQTLAAGAEVMSATRGQWGERHADDVRHMRNRRGLMAYHIAVHKGFQALTELLHPDIPYTFIFSNDDMGVGSVRMFGPPRLMVIAAKALQQKLVDELDAVEKAPPGFAAKPQQPAGAVAALVAVPAAAPPAEQPQQGPVVANGRAGSAGAEAVDGIVSPFAAKAHRRWTTSSFSGAPSFSQDVTTPGASPAATGTAAGVGTPSTLSSLSAATDGAAPTPAGTAVALLPDDQQSSVGVPVAAAGADSGRPAEHSFDCLIPGGRLLAPTPTAPAALQERPTAGSSGNQDSFAGFAVAAPGSPIQGQQQQQICTPRDSLSNSRLPDAAAAGSQPPYSSAASDVSASVSTSTWPGSTAALAGTPCGSVVGVQDISMTTSHGGSSRGTATSPTHQGWASGRQYSRTGSAGAAAAAAATAAAAAADVAAGNGSGAAQGGTAGGPSSAAAGAAGGVGGPGGGPRGRHRRVQSTAEAGSRKMQYSSSHREGAAGGDQASRGTWLRKVDSLGSFKRGRRGTGEEMMPASFIKTTAADDDPEDLSSSSTGNQQQFGAQPQESATGVTVISSPRASISAPIPEDAAAGPSAGSGGDEDNPLDVLLATRADEMRDNPDKIRQQLRLMKLASGALTFNNAASALSQQLHANAGSNAESRLGSLAGGREMARRSSAAGRGGNTWSGSPAAAAAAVTAAAAAAPAAGSATASHGTSPTAQLSPASGLSPSHSDADLLEPQDASQQQQQPGLQLSSQPSAHLCTLNAAMAQQPSLQRLLSGRSRSHLPSLASADGGSTAPVANEAAAAVGGSGTVSSSSSAPAGAAVGGLPVIQQQPVGGRIQEEAEGDAGDDDDDTCEICFDGQAVVALQRCGHTLCVVCCKEMCKLHHFKPALCPYCRQIIAGFEHATAAFIP